MIYYTSNQGWIKPKEEMTHEEAITVLKGLNLQVKGQSTNYHLALNKAIENMEQCEVFNEPVKMDVCNQNNDWHEARIEGKFKGLYLENCKTIETYYYHRKARPIKKEPLSFESWFRETYPYDKDICVNNLDSYYELYQEYLKGFKQENQNSNK